MTTTTDTPTAPSIPFATVSDLEARWHTLTTDETSQATVLLSDASQMIIDICPQYASASMLTLTSIVCMMVKRAMIQDSDDQVGVSSLQQTAGVFSENVAYANPMGDLYLTKAEKQRLGKGTQQAFSLDMSTGAVA